MARIVRASLVAVLVATGLALLMGPAAHAGGVPFTDPSATGGIGLCNAAGQEIDSGSIYTKPFEPLAVSTVAAPTSFSSPGRKAVLYAFQPRQGVDPTEWNGDPLSADSSYSNAKVPEIQATNLDYSLADFMAFYPPTWNGYIQLRMLFGHIGGSYDTDTYAASVIRVSGATWSVVNPVTVNCHAGTAITAETLLSTKQRAYYLKLASSETTVNTVKGPVSVVPPSEAPTEVAVTPSPSVSVSGSTTVTVSPGPVTQQSVIPVTSLYNTGSGSSDTAETVIAVLVVVVLVLAAGARIYLWRKPRHATTAPRPAGRGAFVHERDSTA